MILAKACERATATAYKAVMKPKEGTILTAVSYTHLDVYKRQAKSGPKFEEVPRQRPRKKTGTRTK